MFGLRIGIVGSEDAKFTPETQELARREIRRLIDGASLVVSGECHLGGVDIWAREEAEKAGIPFLPCPPAKLQWKGGYEQRNLKIARESDLVVCITVKELPKGYSGMRFSVGCYHCGTPADHHVKSGGCYTTKQAKKMGKQTRLIVINGRKDRDPMAVRVVQMETYEFDLLNSLLEAAHKLRLRSEAGDYKGAMYSAKEVQAARDLGGDLKAVIDAARAARPSSE